jgi:hypothetical protein
MPSNTPPQRYIWEPKDVFLGKKPLLEGFAIPRKPRHFDLHGRPYAAVFTGGGCGSPCYFEQCHIYDRRSGVKVGEFCSAQLEKLPWPRVRALGLQSEAAQAMNDDDGAWLMHVRRIDFRRGTVHDAFSGKTLPMPLSEPGGFYPKDAEWEASTN